MIRKVKLAAAVFLSAVVLAGCQGGKNGSQGVGDSDSVSGEIVAQEAVAPLDTVAVNASLNNILKELYGLKQNLADYDKEKVLMQKYGSMEFVEAMVSNYNNAKSKLDGQMKNAVMPVSLFAGGTMDWSLLPTDGSADLLFNGYEVTETKIAKDGKTADVTVTVRSNLVDIYDYETGEEYKNPPVTERYKETVTFHFVKESLQDSDWKIYNIEMKKLGSLKEKMKQNKFYVAGFAG